MEPMVGQVGLEPTMLKATGLQPAALPILLTDPYLINGREGGIRTHSPKRNGFTVRRRSPTRPPPGIMPTLKTERIRKTEWVSINAVYLLVEQEDNM